MVNSKFKQDWLNLLKYNDNVQIKEDPKHDFEQKLRIPLTNIDLEAYILYYLSRIYYPEFINDQNNILDIILSKDESKIIGVYFYDINEAGVHESYDKLSEKIIKFQKESLNNLEDFFKSVQLDLEDKHNIKISSFRIFNEKLFDLIDDHYRNIEDLSFNQLFERLLRLLQEMYDDQLIRLFPTPNSHVFITNLLQLLRGVNLPRVSTKLESVLPSFNLIIVIGSEDYDIILKLFNKSSMESEPKVQLQVYSHLALDLEKDTTNMGAYLNEIKEKLGTELVYYISQEKLISLLSNVFELDIPPRKDHLLLILQKILFGMRNFERHWYLTPKPPVYSVALRFILRLFGINLNLKKISHYAIPTLVSNTIDSYLGLKSRIVIIYTDINGLPKSVLKEGDYLLQSFEGALLLDIQDSNVINVQVLPREKITNEKFEKSLMNIRNKLSRELGHVSLVISVDKEILKVIVNHLILDFTKFNPIKKFSILKKIKKDYYFNFYPELPPLKFIKEKGVYSLFRKLLPVMIDKHEF